MTVQIAPSVSLASAIIGQRASSSASQMHATQPIERRSLLLQGRAGIIRGAQI